jgi:hypothetical protein
MFCVCKKHSQQSLSECDSILDNGLCVHGTVLPTQDDLMDWLQRVDNPNPPNLATPLGQLPEAITKSIKIPAVLKPSPSEGSTTAEALPGVTQSDVASPPCAGHEPAVSSNV